MFCPNCGTELENNAVFCSNCGANVTNEQKSNAEETSAQPTETPVAEQISQDNEAIPTIPTTPASPPVKQHRLKKGKYIKQLGSKKVKALSIIVWAVFLALVCVLGLGSYNIIGAGITDIPVVAMVVPEKQMNSINETANQAKELIETADEALEDVKDEISNDEYEMLKGFLNDAKALADNPSVNNIKNMITRFDEVTEMAEKYTDNEDIKEIKEQIDSVDFIEDLAEPMKYFDIAVYIFFGFVGFIVLLLLLATAIKSNALTVICIILSAPVFCFIAGLVYSIIAVVLFIALIVMFCIINGEYRKYRKSLRNA